MDINILSRYSVAKDLNLLGKHEDVTQESLSGVDMIANKLRAANLKAEAMAAAAAVSSSTRDSRPIPKSATRTHTNNFTEENDDEESHALPKTTTATISNNSNTLPPRQKSASWINLSSITADEREKYHYEDLFGCATRNFGKGFLLGSFGKMGVNTLLLLIQLSRGKKISIQKALIMDGARDMGLFLGTLLSMFNSIMYSTRFVENPFFAKYRGFFSGVFSGPAILLLPPEHRRSAILFLFVRALELFIRMAASRGSIPSLDNGDVYTTSFASGIIMYLWAFHSQHVDPSYSHFLATHSQMTPSVREALFAASSGAPIPNLELLNATRSQMKPAAAALKEYSYKLNESGFARSLLYPNSSYLEFIIRFFIQALRKALPVYLPVYMIPLILFQHRRLLKDPKGTLTTAISGVLTSTLFLGTFTTSGIGSLSIFRTLGLTYSQTPRFSKIVFFLSGLLGGFSTFIEKKARRMEIGLFILTKAVDASQKLLMEKGCPILPGTEIFLTSITFGIVTHCYCRYPDLIRGIYHGVMRVFFDSLDSRHKFLT